MLERMLVLSDIDGTVTKNPAIMVRMVEVHAQNGTMLPGHIQRVREHFARFSEGNLSYEDFAEELLIRYAAGLNGIHLQTILSEVRDNINNGTIPLFTNISSLLHTLQTDHDLYFVTASPQFIAQAVAERFPPANYLSTLFEVDSGFLTGKVQSSLARRETKQAAIAEVVARYPKAGSVALGDTMGDIAILEAAQTSICVNPEEELRRLAQERSYTILEGKE